MLSQQDDPTKPAAIDAQLATEFAELGAQLPAELVEDEPTFEVWEENVVSLNAFFAVETQWRFLVAGGLAGSVVVRTGLDYAAVDTVLRRRGLGDAVFEDILVMEQAALSAWENTR